jgi:hypothetical protein
MMPFAAPRPGLPPPDGIRRCAAADHSDTYAMGFGGVGPTYRNSWAGRFWGDAHDRRSRPVQHQSSSPRRHPPAARRAASPPRRAGGSAAPAWPRPGRASSRGENVAHPRCWIQRQSSTPAGSQPPQGAASTTPGQASAAGRHLRPTTHALPRPAPSAPTTCCWFARPGPAPHPLHACEPTTYSAGYPTSTGALLPAPAPAPASPPPASLSASPRATMAAVASQVIMGLAPEGVGNRLVSATNRPATSQHSPAGSHAEPSPGAAPAGAGGRGRRPAAAGECCWRLPWRLLGVRRHPAAPAAAQQQAAPRSSGPGLPHPPTPGAHPSGRSPSGGP